MGTYNSTYVGVFLEVPIVEKDVPYTVKVNSEGKEYGDDIQFCPATGEKLLNVEKYKGKKVYPQAYIEDGELYGDTFWTPEYHQNSDTVKYFLINGRDSFHVIVEECETYLYAGASCFDEMIESFKHEYSEYLEYYKSLGYDYKIKWGVVNYTH